MGLGTLSLRNLFFSRARLGVRAHRPALHHLFLHCAAPSSNRKAGSVDGLWRALWTHRAFKSVDHVYDAISAWLRTVPGSQGGKTMDAEGGASDGRLRRR